MVVESHTHEDLININEMADIIHKIIDIDDFLQIQNIIQNTINSIPDVTFSCLCFLEKKIDALPLYSSLCRNCEKMQGHALNDSAAGQQPGTADLTVRDVQSGKLPDCRFRKVNSFKVFPLEIKNRIFGNWIIRFNNPSSCSIYEPYIKSMLKTFSLKIAYALVQKEKIPDNTGVSPVLPWQLAEHMPVGLCIFHMENPADDTSLRLVYFNPAAKCTLSLNPGELIGITIDEGFKNLRSLGIPAKIADVIRQKKTILIENSKYSDDRIQEGTFTIKIFPLPDNHVGIIFENITKRIEQDSLEHLQEREIIIYALFESAKAVLQKKSFQNASQVIFSHLKKVIKVKAGYAALLAGYGGENKVLFLDPEGFPCAADADLLMSHKGIGNEICLTGKPVYYNDFSSSKLQKLLPPDHMDIKNVMYIPLNVSGKTAGFMALANKETDFDMNDMEIGAAFGELVVIALKNSYNMESLKTSEQKYRQLVNTLQEGIWMFDTQAKITFVNPEIAKMLGYIETEMLGKSIFDFLGKEEIDRARIRLENRKQGITEKYECQLIKKDGTPIYIRVAAVPLIDDNGNYTGILAGITDLTERKKAEMQLENSLKEKEILLQEIHHRVKNNLMVISSLMGLQIRRIKDKTIQSILEDTRNRVFTMSLTHQLLYQSRNFDHINLHRYIHDLLYYLVQSFKINTGNINIKIEVEEIRLNLNQAIPCGMMISELVSNSMKYAFPDDKRGEINIILYTENRNIVLKVYDNGIGLPAGFDTTRTESLGMFLIHSFADQLNGKAQFSSQGGVTFSVTFPCIDIQEKEA